MSYIRAMERELTTQMIQKPEYAYEIYRYKKERKHYPEWLRNCIYQNAPRFQKESYLDIFSFLKLIDANKDDLYIKPIDIKYPPVSNKNVKENNRRLSVIQSPFGALFSGTSASIGDGHLEWSDDIYLIRLGDILFSRKPKSKKLSPSSCILEVGTTSGGTTYWHLMRERILARWPYNSECIYLLYLDIKETQLSN